MYPFSSNIIFNRILGLLKSKIFWIMTLICNSVVVLSAFVFYQIEHGTNPQMEHFIDALWWSFATVTTVGYGDISPKTVLGKILGISLMIGGTAMFATFTALFANAILAGDFRQISTKIKGIEIDEQESEKQIIKMTEDLSRIEKKLNDLNNNLNKNGDKDA